MSDVKQFIDFFENEYGEEVTTFNHIELLEYINYMRNKKNYKFTTMNRKIAALSNYDDFLIETKRKDEKAVRSKDYFKIQRNYITADMLYKDRLNLSAVYNIIETIINKVKGLKNYDTYKRK